jgi:diguanylate cyclase (GGDEF)-like protein
MMPSPGGDSPRGLAEQAPLLADLLALPPLGQIGRQRYGPFLRAVLRLFAAQGATVGFWVSPHEIRRFRVRAGEGGGDVHEDVADPGRLEGPAGRALDQGATLVIAGDGSRAVQPEGADYPGHDSTSCLLVGLRMRDEPPALLALHRFDGAPFTEQDGETAEAAAPLFATALDNLRRFSRAEELSITDSLTGVYNYRYLRSALDKEVARARRFGEKFSIIMLDVDHLKDYNDLHGHLRGSEVLRRLAQLVLAQLRGADVVAKYGGDEFVVILPQTDRAGAGILAERIRSAIEQHEFPGESESMKITSSMGIAQFPEDGESTRELLDVADAALYQAKRTGRNRVTADSKEK